MRVILASIISFSLATTAVGFSRSYDGVWWHSVDRDTRIGWLAGYIDCETRHGNKALLGVSWYNLELDVSRFYETDPNRTHFGIVDVLQKITASRASVAKTSSHGELSGGFDGEYWRQTPEQRQGFVKGYLGCYTNLKGKKASFSKPASWYVAEMSKWYGIKDDDIDPKRADVAIDTVLFRFKDWPKSSKGIRNSEARPEKRSQISQ